MKGISSFLPCYFQCSIKAQTLNDPIYASYTWLPKQISAVKPAAQPPADRIKCHISSPEIWRKNQSSMRYITAHSHFAYTDAFPNATYSRPPCTISGILPSSARK
jgi:hypothetical protein